MVHSQPVTHMLVIRKEQMSVLEVAMASRFRGKLCEHLRQELPEETKTLPDPQLRSAVEEGIVQGRQYGITTERDLTLFVDLTFLLSPAFEHAPGMEWAKRILLNKEMDGETKMSLIYQKLAAAQQPPEPVE